MEARPSRIAMRAGLYLSPAELLVLSRTGGEPVAAACKRPASASTLLPLADVSRVAREVHRAPARRRLMVGRRSFLEAFATLPSFSGSWAAAAGARIPVSPDDRDYFNDLGVNRIINAAGTYTRLTASRMPEEVLSAMQYAARRFVRLDELHDRIGERIASLLGCEGAMVPAGAASGLTLGTAACLTGGDAERIQRLPDTTGMKHEVIVQKAHRNGYDHAVRACGVELVEVETAADLEQAVGERTAMMIFFNAWEPQGRIQVRDWVALGKKHGIPTFIDAAADVPPVENLFRFTEMGFDLVTISGGKGIRGPQSAGLLLGRKDLIQAARLNTSPHSDSIGRGMKVNKEELLGMLVALELYLKRDHLADWKEWELRVETMAEIVGSVPGVTTETYVPEIANQVPHLRIRWDPDQVRVPLTEAVQKLRDGLPSIEVVPRAADADSLEVASWMLEPGEAEIVGRRIVEVLSGA
jgi:L-seryl-tRNA(Ser) seleniumtransferase